MSASDAAAWVRVAVVAVVCIVALVVMRHQDDACRASGGTTVRGLVWIECVKPQEAKP